MQFLLCAATELEIEATRNFIEQRPTLRSKVSVLITGVGLTAATYSLTKAIATQRPQFVLQAGICGSLSGFLKPGDLVVVEKETIGDLGVMEKGSFRPLSELDFIKTKEAPWEDDRLTNNVALLKRTNLKIVDAVTVNEITTSKERIAFYRDVLKANIETMEGAALHYVCLMEKVPFLQLRSVSNFVGEREKQKWTITESIAQLNMEVQSMLVKLFGS
jgi:futalosine hydrolase